MPLPEHTQALLHATGEWLLPDAWSHVCEGSKFHTPTPMVVDSYPLVPATWGPLRVLPSQTVWLCGTCRDNLTLLQQIWVSLDGDVPWLVRREFGNTIRALTQQAWAQHKESTEVAA